MIEPMNYLRIDAAVFGNHEFDFKLDFLKNYIEKSKFPWILSNLRDKETKMPLLDAPEYIILDKNQIKIGIIGLIS